MSSATVSSQRFLAQRRHRWTPLEDAALVSCMVEFHNVGHHNAETGFKVKFLPEIERMPAEKLPGCGLKARPHIESRLKTLKREWSVVYEMIYGNHSACFVWDNSRNMVTAADDEDWNADIQIYKDAAPFRSKSFVHFDDLTRIYARDRANGRNSQTVQELLAEAENEDTSWLEHEIDHNDPIVDHELSTSYAPAYTAHTSNQVSQSTNAPARASKKRKRKADAELHKLSTLLAKAMTAPITDCVQEKIPLLHGELSGIDGITQEEICKAEHMFAERRNLVLVFFGVQQIYRLKWLQARLLLGGDKVIR